VYAANRPTVYVDPTGHWVESVWDAASLGMGAVSLYHNVKEGNWGWAALDVVGVVADTVALALPVIPGGAGAAIKASRAAKMGIDALQTVDQAANVGQGIAQANEEYQQGNTGWAAFYGGMSALGARSATAKGRGLAKDVQNLSEAEKAGVKLEAHSGDAAKPHPRDKTGDIAEPLDNAVKPTAVRTEGASPASARTSAAESSGGVRSRGGPWSEVEAPWGRKALQRPDVEWGSVRPKNTKHMPGITNQEAAELGYAPVRVNPDTGKIDTLTLHHLGKEPGGAVAEVWSPTHGARHRGDRAAARLGIPDPLRKWRATNPEWRKWWEVEQSVYWRWYKGGYVPPAGGVLMPPPIKPNLPK
jgi:hypothetical protein